MDERFYLPFAAAAVRGCLIREGKREVLPEAIFEKPLAALQEPDLSAIIEAGIRQGVKLYDFKRSHRYLPRVNWALGFLKGISFRRILDVGSGRGVFLIPLLSEFPDIEATTLEIQPQRLLMWRDIVLGGEERLTVKEGDVTTQPFGDATFDVVTMLEVLEHIPDYRAAIRAAVAMASSYVVVSVPSREDQNPEHIHLLTKERLTDAFHEAGIERLSFGGVPGHLTLIARIGG